MNHALLLTTVKHHRGALEGSRSSDSGDFLALCSYEILHEFLDGEVSRRGEEAEGQKQLLTERDLLCATRLRVLQKLTSVSL